MKELAVFKTRAESGALTERLDKEKIPYFVLADISGDTPSEAASAIGVKVVINDGDFEKAAKLL